MNHLRVLCSVLTLGLAGCAADEAIDVDTDDQAGHDGTAVDHGGGDFGTAFAKPARLPTVPDGCAKIEGEDIGDVGATLEVGSGYNYGLVTFTAWTEKTDSPGEFVGFTWTTTGTESHQFTVKAGTSYFDATTSTWLHPNGTSGSAAKAISNIVFCPVEECAGDDCEEPECTPGVDCEEPECTPGVDCEEEPGCLDSLGCDVT